MKKLTAVSLLALGIFGVIVALSSNADALPKSLRNFFIKTARFQNGATIVNDTNNEIQFGDGTEDISMGFATSNTLVWSSDTGVVTHDLGATGATLILANDQTIVSDTDNEIQFGDGSEDLSLGFATANEVTVTTDTGVTRVNFESIGVKTATPLLMVRSAYFCGNAANATTAVYMPPVQHTIADNTTTYVYGGAGCDGLDNTTETSGDGLLKGNGALAVKVIGMACGISAAGTDDVYTFQLRDDEADATGVTCNVTLSGSIEQCSVLLDAPVTVAAGSLLAVQSAAATDDDVSSADVECVIFYSY